MLIVVVVISCAAVVSAVRRAAPNAVSGCAELMRFRAQEFLTDVAGDGVLFGIAAVSDVNAVVLAGSSVTPTALYAFAVRHLVKFVVNDKCAAVIAVYSMVFGLVVILIALVCVGAVIPTALGAGAANHHVIFIFKPVFAVAAVHGMRLGAVILVIGDVCVSAGGNAGLIIPTAL